MSENPRCSLCTPGVRPLAFCSRHALALVNRTVSKADLEHLYDDTLFGSSAFEPDDSDTDPHGTYHHNGERRTITETRAL